ncbi:MAG: histidinol dehydrogenase, partial [Alphaproteobacteria bacterium]|nr:histidinol dehydrogenase [Alphaproteobacteria bacterium]
MPTHIKNNRFSALEEVLKMRQQDDAVVTERVQSIIDDVRLRGDIALREYTARFDGHTPENFRLNSSEIAEAAQQCSPEVREALDFAARRIRAFHERSLPKDLEYTDDDGVRMGYRYRPVSAAGVYVPGGLAAYPSSVLMSCIPAQVAGVARIVLCTPTPNRVRNPAVMAALEILGLREVYIVGGAQAIAVLAYGTESIAAVDFIAGPGNVYVAAAKKYVFGAVGIDSLAGPSEVTVVADGGADPHHVALDLLAQAEHDTRAQSILISDDEALIAGVNREITDLLQFLPRSEIAGASWRDFGVTVLLDDLCDAAKLVDRIAPEHLILSIAEPEALFGGIQHVGSVFLGYHTPEAIGDYLSGPSHVLPTSGSARYASGLSSESFMKRSSF